MIGIQIKRLANQKNKANAGKIIQSIFIAFCLFLNIHFAYAQTAQGGIIPNGKNVFLDQNGKPLTGGKVYFYIPSTTTPKTTYSDINLTIPNTNPVVLDAAGRAILWGSGNYRQQVYDKNNNLIWDVTTSAAGSGSGGGSIATGDGDLVGTIKPWAGATAPNQYMFTYGQEVSRTTYAILFTAITSTQSIFCTSGSAILNGVGDTTNFWIGMTVEVACVPAGFSTIISKTSNSVTLAANANVSENINATFFMWGRGNGSTTFNLPDFRGLIPMGNNIMGGVASSNISDANFGSQLPESAGGKGGNQSVQLGSTNLPVFTSSGSNSIAPGGLGQFVIGNGSIGGLAGTNTGGAVVAGTSGGGATFAGISNVTASISVTSSTGSGGSAVAFSIIPPAKTVNYIIKVTPDVNSATASGVTSLGGMTGSIACGSGLICTGNIINTIGSAAGGSNTQVQYNNSGALAGSSCLTWVSSVLSIGVNGTCGGQLQLFGATSGSLIQQVASVAGTPTVTWGTNSGTPVVTATSPLVINTTTGNLTCTTCLTNTPAAFTSSNDTNVTITLGGTPATSLLQAVSATMGWSGVLAISRGGTGQSSLTSNAFLTGNGTSGINQVALSGAVLGNGTSAPTAYGGNSCTNQVITSLTSLLALGCASITNSFLTAGTFSNITGVGTLTAGATGSGFTINLGTSTISGQLPITNGGSSQSTVLSARGSSGFNIDEATSTGDANYVIQSTDRMVYHTALSAARTDTLPAANSVNAGQLFIINDFRGVATVSNTITLQRAGSDTINGVSSVVAINAQYGAGIFWSDGSSRWTFFPASTGSGSGTVTQVTPGNGLVSSTTASCSQTAITTTGTLYTAQCINAQTGTSYAIQDSDRAKLITASNSAAQAYTIAQAGASSNFQSGWYVDIQNNSTNSNGIITITATTSNFQINGLSTSTIKINLGQSTRIVSDGTNYQVYNHTLTNATLMATPSNPTGTTSTAGLMMGLGSTCTITPQLSTRVMLHIYGSITNTSVTGANSLVQARFGTGSAPANAAALTGTTVGSQVVSSENSFGGPQPFHIGGIVTGLTPNTAIWIDAAVSSSSSGSTASITGLTCYALEF